MADRVPEFPEGYRAALTNDHDGTGGTYVELHWHGKVLTKAGGGGWNDSPFWHLAGYAEAHAQGVEDASNPEVELRDRVTASEPLRRAQAALSLLDRGCVALAAEEVEAIVHELSAQAAGWEAVAMMLDDEPHVCTCDHSDADPALAGCADGFSCRCRFEKALRTMVGLDG